MVFYGETIHLHRISERERNGEGKENGGESVAQTWLDLNSASLGCEEYRLNHSLASTVDPRLSGPLWQK